MTEIVKAMTISASQQEVALLWTIVCYLTNNLEGIKLVTFKVTLATTLITDVVGSGSSERSSEQHHFALVWTTELEIKDSQTTSSPKHTYVARR